MEEHKVTDNRLYIPENVPLRWELLRGFGFRELMQSAVIGCRSRGSASLL